MSNPTSFDIKDIIQSQKIAIFGQDMFTGFMPSEPINCICIYDIIAGSQESNVNIDVDQIMIKSRNVQYTDGYAILAQIKTIFQSKKPEIVNNTPYIGFWLTSSIGFNGYNELNHAVWSVNIRVMRHPDNNINR